MLSLSDTHASGLFGLFNWRQGLWRQTRNLRARRSWRILRETAKLKAPRTPAFAELCGQKAFALRIDRIQPWKVVSKLVVAWDGVIHAVPVQTVAMGWFVSPRTVVLHIVARSALTASQNGTIAGEMRNVAVG